MKIQPTIWASFDGLDHHRRAGSTLGAAPGRRVGFLTLPGRASVWPLDFLPVSVKRGKVRRDPPPP